MKNKNICVIGLGFVGLTLTIALAKRGFNVYGCENNTDILELLRKGEPHFFEPGLKGLLNKYLNKNIFISQEIEDFKGITIDFLIISVGTPYNRENDNISYESLIESLNGIGKIYNGNQHVILRSTVSVGTTRNRVLPFLRKLLETKKINDRRVQLSFCPERTIEGKALTELSSLPQIIGALDEESYISANELWLKIAPFTINAGSLEGAELVKLFNNTYRDIQFSIGNFFSEISQSYGLDGLKMIDLCNYGYERSNIPKPGFVGGPCLEKDPYILASNLSNNEGKHFVLNSRRFNENLEQRIFNWIQNNVDRSDVIAISGLAYKGTPVTSDLRGSNAVNLCMLLKDDGYSLKIHDFSANKEEMQDLNVGEYFSDFNNIINDSEIIIIANNHPGYQSLFFDKSFKPRILIDVWGVLDKDLFSSLQGIKYYTIGNLFI